MAALVETMMYTREKPWHGLGTRVEEAPTSKDAIELAGLDWTVDANPILDINGSIIEGYKANTRSSDGRVLGVVGNKYSIVQNAEAFEFTDTLLGEGLRYETAGSLRGGKQIWLLGKMPEQAILGDKVEPYICFTNTHDGSGAVRICMTPIRVVCNNTLNMALEGAKRSWSTRHSGDIKLRLEEARQTLQLADLYMKRLDEEADRLANEYMSDGEMFDALDKLIELPKDASDRQKKTAADVKDAIELCVFSPDLARFFQTKWAFLNGVADYVDHSIPSRQTKNWKENRWGSIIAGSTLLDKAMALVG